MDTPTDKNRVVLRRVVLSLLLAAAAGGLWISFAQTRTHEGPRYVDTAIEAVYPGAGDLELRQTRIGIDLQAGYTAVLFVDGREIPEDQVERIASLGQVFYTPGAGKETGALSPGRHCGTALLWRDVQTRETGRRYSWCFNVH